MEITAPCPGTHKWGVAQEMTVLWSYFVPRGWHSYQWLSCSNPKVRDVKSPELQVEGRKSTGWRHMLSFLACCMKLEEKQLRFAFKRKIDLIFFNVTFWKYGLLYAFVLGQAFLKLHLFSVEKMKSYLSSASNLKSKHGGKREPRAVSGRRLVL